MEIKGIEEAIEAEVQRRIAEKLTELAQSFTGKAAAHKAWATMKGKAANGARASSPVTAAHVCNICAQPLRSDNKSGRCANKTACKERAAKKA